MTQARPGVKAMLETVVKAFVDEPEAVEVLEVSKAQTTVFELKVAPADLGKVIGRQGRTARALRAIVAVAGEKLRRRFLLQILD